MADAYTITGELALRKSFNQNDAMRVEMVGTQLAVSLVADEDSITTVPNSQVISDASEVSAIGIKSACLYVESDGAGTAQAKLQVSPVDSGDLWMDVATSTVTASATDLTSSAVFTICARRIRVVSVAGTPVTHLVIQAV
jgi:hypothetical protein